MTRTTTIVAALAAVCAAPALANVVTTDTRATLATPLFVPGNGNTTTDFAITTIVEQGGMFDGNTIELGIKAKERFIGQTNVGGSGNVYEVQPGISTVSGTDLTPDPSRAWWNFDLSVDYGSRSVDDTLITLTVIDPDGDVFFAPFEIDPIQFPSGSDFAQLSWNTGFSFIDAFLGFDPFLTGDYTLTVTAIDRASTTELGSVTAIARVVPTPGAALAFGAMGLAATRRRR